MWYRNAEDRLITFTRTRGARRLLVIVRRSFYILAFLSLTYAVVTAPAEGNAVDLDVFQNRGRSWVSGIYESNVIPGLPPYTIVLFAPLSLISYANLKIVWLALNLATAGLCLHLTIELFGKRWPAEARYFLAAFLLSWAPFRVTIRNGQISLMITALLLGALLARERKKELLAGALLGFALCKYPLSYAFFLYFAWRKEWKIVGTAILIPAVLTQVFAYRLGISVIEVARDYIHLMGKTFAAERTDFIGSTEIKPLLYTLMGGNEFLASGFTIMLSAAALISMALIFRHRPRSEAIHYTVISFFTLWSVYHRVYDSVLCILPAAVVIDFLVRRKHVLFSLAALAGLCLLVVSIPGILNTRLRLSAESLSSNPSGLIGLHIERLLMLAMFCSFMIFLWKSPEADQEPGMALVKAESSA